MVWDELDCIVKAKLPNMARHLWELFKNYYKNIPGGYLMKVTERMSRVCKAVIKAKGGYFGETKIWNIIIKILF